MNFSKFLVIILSILFANSNLIGYPHAFKNDTNETVDVEVSLEGLSKHQNRLVERIVPGERRTFDTPGIYCLQGINIWRFQKQRNPAGLIGTWNFAPGTSIDPVLQTGKYVGTGRQCGGNEWRLSGHASGNTRTEGSYRLEHFGGYYPGEFLQGSDAAWTKRYPGIS